MGVLHCAAVERLPALFSLVAIADPDAARAQGLAERFGAAVHMDHVTMARQTSLDAAIVASPDAAHRRQVIDLIENGIPVLVEKPMALSTSECREMASASATMGVALAVGHLQRYLPRVASAVRLIREGAIGEVRMIVDRISSRYEHGTRPDWFLEARRSPNGILANLGCHIIDRFYVLSGSPGISVHQAWLDGESVPTEVAATVKLANGAHATMLLTGTGLPTSEMTDIVGTAGALRISSEGGLQHFVYGEIVYEEAADPEGDRAAFAAQLRDFHRAVSGASPQVDAAYGIAVMTAVELIAAAASDA